MTLPDEPRAEGFFDQTCSAMRFLLNEIPTGEPLTKFVREEQWIASMGPRGAQIADACAVAGVIERDPGGNCTQCTRADDEHGSLDHAFVAAPASVAVRPLGLTKYWLQRLAKDTTVVIDAGDPIAAGASGFAQHGTWDGRACWWLLTFGADAPPLPTLAAGEHIVQANLGSAPPCADATLCLSRDWRALLAEDFALTQARDFAAGRRDEQTMQLAKIDEYLQDAASAPHVALQRFLASCNFPIDPAQVPPEARAPAVVRQKKKTMFRGANGWLIECECDQVAGWHLHGYGKDGNPTAPARVEPRLTSFYTQALATSQTYLDLRDQQSRPIAVDDALWKDLRTVLAIVLVGAGAVVSRALGLVPAPAETFVNAAVGGIFVFSLLPRIWNTVLGIRLALIHWPEKA